MPTVSFGNDPAKIARYRAFWNRDDVARPLVGFTRIGWFPLEEFQAAKTWGSDYLTPEMIDPAAFIDDHLRMLSEGEVLDEDLIRQLALNHEVLVTVEEGSIGGFSSHVLGFLADSGLLDRGLKVRAKVLPDTFIDQDSPNAMYAKAGLDAKGIVAKAFEALGQNLRGETVKLVRQ